MKNFIILSSIIKDRRSIRKFNCKPVDLELVKKIIDIASHAPSNNNRQGWKFFVFQNPQVKKEISDRIIKQIKLNQNKSKLIDELMTTYQENFTYFKNAPLVIACCFVKPSRFQYKIFETNEENRHLTGELISLSLVIQNILLLSESAGIGTLVMTSPLIVAQDIKEILNIPKKYSIGAFVCMGYYDKRPAPPAHLSINQILHMEK